MTTDKRIFWRRWRTASDDQSRQNERDNHDDRT
jgi:hypothetical protein